MYNKEVNFKRIMRLRVKPAMTAMVICFLFPLWGVGGFSSFAQNPKGTAGTLTWELNLSDSTLTINGNDIMPDYIQYQNIAPWRNYPTSIATVVIANNVKSVGNYAFINCYNLRSVVISNSVITVGEYAFGGCRNLTSVTIPNSVITIGTRAFNNCVGLTSVSIENSATTMGEYAFSGCSNLTSITIPNLITTIEIGVFLGCKNLTSVIIPNSVTTIKSNAFANCESLTSVTIPSSISTIGFAAFYCENLDTIICEASTPPDMSGGFAFWYDVSSISVYVPCGSIAAYQNADSWKDFTNYQAIGGIPLPAVPDNVSVSQKDNALEISWESTGAVRYEIYRNNALLSTTTTTIYRDSNLTNNVNYCYKINAVGDSCVSGLSSEVCKKFTSDVGTTNYELEITNYVKIYPNPTTGKLRITNYELRDNAVIEIFSVVGQVVFTSTVSTLSPETTIDISHLANGMYFMKIDGKTMKIVKN